MLDTVRILIRMMAACATILALCGGCGTTPVEPSRREDVLQRILPSAVQIILENAEGRRFRTGSGVVIASRGAECFIVTSGHTVTGAIGQKEISLLFGRQRGAGTRASATVLAHRETEEVDIALLRAQTDQCVPARPAAAPELGEAVWVIGFPWGRNMLLASGIVSQVNFGDAADGESQSRLMVDASVSYGSSGGGVYEARGGGLLGLVEGYRTARVTSKGTEQSWYIDVPVPGQTLVTPLTDIRRFLADTGHADLIEGAPASTGRAAR
jgi:S1-C subfamily serine protease